MSSIKTVREFAKSRYTIFFLISMIGLCALLSMLIPPFNIPPVLGFASMTNIYKLISFVWLLIFLTPVFSGNNEVSYFVGTIFIVLSLVLFKFLPITVFNINSRMLCLLLLYFGWHIGYYAKSDKFSSGEVLLRFFISRTFLGFCFMIFGFMTLHKCFLSPETFINFTKNDNLTYFIIGNLCILGGLVLAFVCRDWYGYIVGTIIVLFCALMILQLPTIVLFFMNKSLIKTYYSNVAFHWSMIVAVVLYFGVAGLLEETAKKNL